MNRIVIATDGSDGAWAAVEEGVELAAEVGAEVTFVTVRHGVAACSATPHYQQHLTSAARARARGPRPRRGGGRAGVGVDCESEILEGDPASCIADAARCRDGRPGRRRLARPRRRSRAR